MKTLATMMIVALLTLTTTVFGQTVAIGHATAEVIESVSASASTISSFELSKDAENVKLGAITVFSGKDVTCNVVLKSANLSDASGNAFTIEPTVNNNTAVAMANGAQTIQLNGTTNMNSNQASGQYAGSYTVVFAYN
ncbi:MAG: hypothetical protein WCP85_24870 [Mariniphaga sp.]